MLDSLAPAANLPPDEYLSTEELLALRESLIKQAEGLLSNTHQAVSNLTETREQDADALDLAVNESSREFTLRLADRERRMLKKIQYVLKRMEEGEYGVCESCGAPITHRRLRVRPVATQCIDCKTQAEQLERRSRVF